MPQHSEDVVENRRVTVARLYLQGWYQSRIADEVGVTQQQVSQDLDAIRKGWRESTLFDFNEAKMKELARIDLLETTHWEAWEQSKQPLKKKSTKVKGETKPATDSEKSSASDPETTETTEERLGDPRHLDGVMKCIQKRVDILGLDAPFKVAPTDTDGKTLNNTLVGQWVIKDFTAGQAPPPIDQ